MTIQSGKEDELKTRLKKILSANDIKAYHQRARELSAELGIEILDCAAALVCLNESSGFIDNARNKEDTEATHQALSVDSELRMIRYRLETGRKHQMTVEKLKQILVDETGVERNLIGYVDIHTYHTLIRLPEGMPADIFQHLRTLVINDQELAIKRIRGKVKGGRNRTNNSRGRRWAKSAANNSSGNEHGTNRGRKEKEQN